MRLRHLTLLLALGTAACDDLLDVQPVDETPDTEAIVDAATAEAALVGAYSALTFGSYYAGTFLFFGDLIPDNATHEGTLHSYAEADLLDIRPDNGGISGMWDAIYVAINRANVVIQQIPDVPGLTAGQRARILAEAHFLRALHYHNLVKHWGGVPLVLEPAATIDEASQVSRATADAVYDQILADLDVAEAGVMQSGPAIRATLGAVEALRSRVLLYRGDWAGAETAADAVTALGYRLADDFSTLFDDGGSTPEDIFRAVFTPSDYNLVGYYYISSACGGGRGELGLSPDLVAAFEPGDERGDWTVLEVSGDLCGAKYPTTIGAEDLHVIRYAEVLLNLAEAQARQGRLGDAVDTYNLIRERAGLAPHVLNVDVTTEQDVLEAIWHERRLELAQEGDRWADLVRTGTAGDVVGAEPCEYLYPIPQGEMDVAPNLEQNPVCG